MALILALGSNVGDRAKHLKDAISSLEKIFEITAASRVFESPAVDYLNQADFLNQVLQFELPNKTPLEVLSDIMDIEKSLGRIRDVAKGPRTIDIDIIFWGIEEFEFNELKIPHYAWQERSFVVQPLQDLPYFETIQKSFIIPTEFTNSAKPI